MNESLRRLRDTVVGRNRDREVQVEPDGTVREVPAQGEAQPAEAGHKPTKLPPRTFGAA